MQAGPRQLSDRLAGLHVARNVAKMGGGQIEPMEHGLAVV